jgi:SAM-dependent methyltransferase/uncharacterized protein YbaR (Trm112 family)
MAVCYCCPVHREPLDQSSPERWIGQGHGLVYPVIEGIPILLAREEERLAVSSRDWSVEAEGGADALSFYNQTRDHDQYCRENLDEVRSHLLPFAQLSRGPALEIGSGKGALQGLGEEYVALDYSFTALRAYIDSRHHRVCASAEHLPFPDKTFGLIYSVAALEHVPNADRAFEEIHRILRPGGIVYLAPAWHCVQYNCEGIPVRPYAELNWRQKLVKASLPLRQRRLIKAAGALPGRIMRRLAWSMRRGPAAFKFVRLRPDYQRFWLSDSDAASRLDSHEACLFFHSRDYEILLPGRGTMRQLLAKHEPVVVRKSR